MATQIDLAAAADGLQEFKIDFVRDKRRLPALSLNPVPNVGARSSISIITHWKRRNIIHL